jgi:hypothetical protein
LPSKADDFQTEQGIRKITKHCTNSTFLFVTLHMGRLSESFAFGFFARGLTDWLHVAKDTQKAAWSLRGLVQLIELKRGLLQI